MSRRMRKPETTRLEISRGDWLLVKKYLTAGEYRAMMGRLIKDGGVIDRVDTTRIGISKCAAYLLDWSIEDADGQPVGIADQDPAAIESALDALDVDSFREIRAAIEAHEESVEVELKNAVDGGTTSPVTSPSLG